MVYVINCQDFERVITVMVWQLAQKLIKSREHFHIFSKLEPFCTYKDQSQYPVSFEWIQQKYGGLFFRRFSRGTAKVRLSTVKVAKKYGISKVLYNNGHLRYQYLILLMPAWLGLFPVF